jgi:Fic family protein
MAARKARACHMSQIHYHNEQFPPKEIDWASLVPRIGPASMALARYEGLLAAVPNAYVLLSPLTAQEAVLSSRIEGTQATLGEVLEFEAGMAPKDDSPAKREDIQEVVNYRKAMAKALELLEEMPLCQRVIKEAHRVLLSGVRGQNRSPGEYRRIENWIGLQGCPIEEARFVPINPADLPEGMSRWERYIHDDCQDRLVQLAILHAEFEALHPFLDGNGRLGRMLIPLFLAKTGLLSSPVFYISAHFERNREEYYDRLLRVSSDGDWTGWAVFLKSIEEQAKENADKTRQILDLREKTFHHVSEMTRSKSTVDAVDFLFRRPVFSGSDFTANPAINDPTARRILKLLVDNSLLIELRPASGRRAAVYGFGELLNIVEGRELF